MITNRENSSPPGVKPAQTRSDASSEQDDRFKNLLGAAAWVRLPKAIRHRFSKRLLGDASLAYQGRVTQMRMNPVGRALAFALRVIGAPLPFDRTSIGRSAVVTVTEDAAMGGQFWIRQYGRAAGFPQMVGSSKRFAGPTGLEEYIGFGIGISLKLESTASGLYFISDRYFLKLGQQRLSLPRWACPGVLTVGHEELGSGQFRFTLELTHPLFGELIWQDATFHDAEIIGSVLS
ncbi:protein of unknown function [Ruegeria halocynthiae]|uniref:DUF4166 domain-containing protein n=1 Tax=Ruegeria halocynthiae TaxID=985054 RepID=A0A1H2ZND7_9RHOB|nr:DUF4166 domain-containing protein [Ruegeria halocynthiae]SDX18903.1 protein of unknown function [Ruegeria halocynthiae]